MAARGRLPRGGARRSSSTSCVYLLMNLGAFVVVMACAEAGVGETIESYRGLGLRAPLFAAIDGDLPLLADRHPALGGLHRQVLPLRCGAARRVEPSTCVLAVIGILNSAISLYYYARILKEMFFEKSADPSPSRCTPSIGPWPWSSPRPPWSSASTGRRSPTRSEAR